jgi:hypothetical protein
MEPLTKCGQKEYLDKPKVGAKHELLFSKLIWSRLKGELSMNFVQQDNLAMPKGGAKHELLSSKVIWSRLKVELSMSFCSAR